MGAGLSLLNDLTVIQASQVPCANHIPPVRWIIGKSRCSLCRTLTKYMRDLGVVQAKLGSTVLLLIGRPASITISWWYCIAN